MSTEKFSPVSTPWSAGKRIRWTDVLADARAIISMYDTGVTLRQLFYRLVSLLILPNKQTTYQSLSRKTADARRNGEFPDLVDQTRGIYMGPKYAGVNDALAQWRDSYLRDRTEGQGWSVYLGVEKRGLVQQLCSWFGHLDVPVIELGGYCSQAHVDSVRQHVDEQDRPAVLLYAGDFDASGEDIDRDFIARTDCWDKVERIALNADQVETYDLPPQMGKANDPRASAFTERHGKLVQIELDALPPEVLHTLFTDAIKAHWDEDAFGRVLRAEADGAHYLDELIRRAADDPDNPDHADGPVMPKTGRKERR